jgi:hypothetical protein
MEYTIVNGYFHDFIFKVNDKIMDGWKPQGGVAVVDGNRGKALYSQAMIKEQNHE